MNRLLELIGGPAVEPQPFLEPHSAVEPLDAYSRAVTGVVKKVGQAGVYIADRREVHRPFAADRAAARAEADTRNCAGSAETGGVDLNAHLLCG